MRDWHLRQRGRATARGDRVIVCGSGMVPPVGTGGSVTELSVTGTAKDGAVIGVLCDRRDRTRWSILLTLEKLMATLANDPGPGGLPLWRSHSALRSL